VHQPQKIFSACEEWKGSEWAEFKSRKEAKKKKQLIGGKILSFAGRMELFRSDLRSKISADRRFVL